MNRYLQPFFYFLFLFTLFVFPERILAQKTYKLTGTVTDTASNMKLQNAVVSILDAKDSILVDFKRTAVNGSFSINTFKLGVFIMMVSYPGYVVYVERFKLDSLKKSIDFGQVGLLLKSKMLKEIIVKGEVAAIKIKGDTTEFNAGSYVIQPHAKVEDLLKQLPGLQIDQNGKITANGETVKKVLLDGEEFFGDDPTLVTKNIRGDMVDKVQLYNKKSDQATFTGIDDGKSEKTINIKLKENKKNGYFGKVDAGAGNDDFYQAQAMMNIFKSTQKLAFYGISGNNGKIGLGWQDNSKYGVSTGNNNGIMRIDDGNDDFESFNGNYNGQGLPTAHTAGIHYDTKWRDQKDRLNINYKMGSYGLEGIRDKLSQNNLPMGFITDNSNQKFNSHNFRQKLDATYETKLDSTLNLKISVLGSLKNAEGNTNYNTFALRDSTFLLNTGERNISNNSNEKLFGSTAFLSKKFIKNRRTASLQLSYSANTIKDEQFLNASNSFYNSTGTVDSIGLIDQKKPGDIETTVLSADVSYTEPLTKSLSLVLNTVISINNSQADRRSFNADAAGNYILLDSLFSNDYELKQDLQQAGAIINYKKGKEMMNIGLKTLFSEYTQKDLITFQQYKRNFINWNPQASYQYSFSQQKNIKINYLGTTRQPSISQLQPFRNNIDPLNIFIGNANLNPSFNHKIDFKYYSYKVLSKKAFSLNGYYNLTYSPIVNRITTDSAGKSIYQNVNLSDRQTNNFSLSIGLMKVLQKSGLAVNLMLSGNGNTFYNIINENLNRTDNFNYSAITSISKYNKDKYSFYLMLIPGYNDVRSSLGNSFNNSGWTLSSESSLEIFLSTKFSVKIEGLSDYRQKTQSFDNSFNRMLWNGSLNQKFLKDKSLKFSVSVNDLFNQNTGFNRTSVNNMFVQESYSTIKRYFMGSLTWDFNKMASANRK